MHLLWLLIGSMGTKIRVLTKNNEISFQVKGSAKWWSICSVLNAYSLWLSDAIWRHRHGSTLAQVMAWRLAVPSC